MVNSRCGLVRNSNTRIDNFVPLIRLSTLYLVLDDGLGDLELNIAHGSGVRDSTILEEQVICLLTLMYEKSRVTPIINYQVRYVTITISFRLYKVIQDAVPVLLKTITLPGKYSSRFIMRNDSHSVFLDRENVARSLTEVTDEVLESIDQHYHMDGHVERSRDIGTTRHLKYLLC